MTTINELVKNYKPLYPKFLLRILAIADYNKTLNILGFKINSRLLNIVLLILNTIIMIISYENNDKKINTIVWIGCIIWIFFVLCNFIFMIFVFINNYRIKKICKKYGFTVEEWNKIFFYLQNK